MSSEGQHSDSVDRLIVEYLQRSDAGEQIDRETFLREHPEEAGELSDFFETGDDIDQMAGPTAEEDDSTPTPLIVASGNLTGPELPRVFGDYELLEEIGSGGMGIVYKAMNLREQRIVALKLLKSGLFASEIELKRFALESKSASRLSHPNIVSVRRIGEVDGQQYFSMEYIEGPDLGELRKNGPVDEAFMARTLFIAAEAIHFAHTQGILHRDLKPANILIDEDGNPHVTDFGLAKHMEGDSNLTSTGTALGTPSYMSPEAAAGLGTGPPGDVYSLGAMLYTLMIGEPPFRCETQMETILKVLHQEPTPPSAIDPTVDPALETIALKCLEKDPLQRYSSAHSLAKDLQRYMDGKSIRARPIGALRRGLRWTRGIPVFAALTNRPQTSPTPGQSKAQHALLIGAALLALVALVFLWRSSLERGLPSRVALASAVAGGEYHEFCEALSEVLSTELDRPIDVLETEGSLANRQHLLNGEAHLALLQASVVDPQEISVIAPLYHDVLFLVVRTDSGIAKLEQLRGQRVSIGLHRSGMQASAVELLEHFEMTPDDLVDPFVHFTILGNDESYRAAIVTTGVENEDMVQLMRSGEFQLLAVPENVREAITGAVFSTMTLHVGELWGSGTAAAFPANDVATLRTTTFLAAELDAPVALITESLEAIYLESELVTRFRLSSLDDSAEWQMLALHPAAREFFKTHANRR